VKKHKHKKQQPYSEVSEFDNGFPECRAVITRDGTLMARVSLDSLKRPYLHLVNTPHERMMIVTLRHCKELIALVEKSLRYE